MNTELPLGFGMALAQNEAAMRRFESLNEPEKQVIPEQGARYYLCQDSSCAQPVDSVAELEALSEL